ncbi:MAG TPA: hypothetical protein VFP65_11810 [Anaeromyxobacteraceae bacterium]|nr:hypothetical protein [Anaeromyxobacteraceae bacterium]
MATVAVGIRMERGVWERHSAAAQSLGVPLSVYLRRRLEEQERMAVALAEVQASLERSAAAAAAERGLLVEMLLILRQLAGPQRSVVAQREVERQGLELWSG